MPQFRSREIVNAIRLDPANPPPGLAKDDGDDFWYVEDCNYFSPANPGDWILLDIQGRAIDSFPDAEFQARYEPLSQIEATPDLLAACEAYDAAWTRTCPEGPDIGAPRLSASTIVLWRQIRAALAKAKVAP